MSESMFMAVATFASLVLMLAISFPLIICRWKRVERETREAKERRDAAWLALVDEWNQPSIATERAVSPEGSAAHVRTTPRIQKAAQSDTA